MNSREGFLDFPRFTNFNWHTKLIFTLKSLIWLVCFWPQSGIFSTTFLRNCPAGEAGILCQSWCNTLGKHLCLVTCIYFYWQAYVFCDKKLILVTKIYFSQVYVWEEINLWENYLIAWKEYFLWQEVTSCGRNHCISGWQFQGDPIRM